MNQKQKREFEEFMRAVMNSKESDEVYNRIVKSLYELHCKMCPKKALVEFDVNNPPKSLSEIVHNFKFKIEKRESIFSFILLVKNTVLKEKNIVQVLIKPEDLFDYLYAIQKLGLESSNIEIGPSGENAIITICNSTTEKEKIINLINKL